MCSSYALSSKVTKIKKSGNVKCVISYLPINQNVINFRWLLCGLRPLIWLHCHIRSKCSVATLRNKSFTVPIYLFLFHFHDICRRIYCVSDVGIYLVPGIFNRIKVRPKACEGAMPSLPCTPDPELGLLSVGFTSLYPGGLNTPLWP